MKILLVEDDVIASTLIKKFLNKIGDEVIECKNGLVALEAFHSNPDIELVISDLNMPEMNGMQLLKELYLLKGRRSFEIIILTGNGDMESAIEALRAGAVDYFLKPVNLEDLRVVVDSLRKIEKDSSSASITPASITSGCMDNPISLAQLKIGLHSNKMKQIVNHALKYHKNRSIPVLIEGETGTGKELFARLIHYGEDYLGNHPFIDINCASFNPALFESEFFGYEAGAFTGALTRGNLGKLDLAEGGTLFLDEIGELPMDLQAKLLRVLQEKEYYRVGGLKKIQADVRIICATNVDLKNRIEIGSFRRDLFYRLNVGYVYIPPLRERKDEIAFLAEMFLREVSSNRGGILKEMTNEAIDMLVSYNWPGNVRELRNVIEWIDLMVEGSVVEPAHLRMIMNQDRPGQTKGDPFMSFEPEGVSLPDGELPLENHINDIIMKALEKHNGNKAKTASYLGITRRALYSRLKRVSASAKK